MCKYIFISSLTFISFYFLGLMDIPKFNQTLERFNNVHINPKSMRKHRDNTNCPVIEHFSVSQPNVKALDHFINQKIALLFKLLIKNNKRLWIQSQRI